MTEAKDGRENKSLGLGEGVEQYKKVSASGPHSMAENRINSHSKCINDVFKSK